MTYDFVDLSEYFVQLFATNRSAFHVPEFGNLGLSDFWYRLQPLHVARQIERGHNCRHVVGFPPETDLE